MSMQEWRNLYNLPLEKKLISFLEENYHMHGAAMQIASNMWREKDPIGAFAVGPCYRQIEVYGGYFEILEERNRLRKELEEKEVELKRTRITSSVHEGNYNAYFKECERLGKELEEAQVAYKNLQTARPLEEWGEDYGDVLWWKFPIEEPPYCGNPLDSEWLDDYYTHWTPIVTPDFGQEGEGNR